MSDTPEGTDWWQASDGKWYPPQPPAPAAPPPPPPASAAPPPAYTAPPAPPPPGYIAVGGYPPAAPASTGMSGCLKWGLIVGGILMFLGLGSCVVLVAVVDDAVDEVGDDLTRTQADELDDISDLDCDTDESGFLEATMTVTNDSSERSNYLIEISFTSGDEAVQLDTAFASVTALEPGQRTTATAGTATEPAGEFSCRVGGVERFSDEG